MPCLDERVRVQRSRKECDLGKGDRGLFVPGICGRCPPGARKSLGVRPRCQFLSHEPDLESGEIGPLSHGCLKPPGGCDIESQVIQRYAYVGMRVGEVGAR